MFRTIYLSLLSTALLCLLILAFPAVPFAAGATSPTSAAESERFEEYNFTFDSPGWPWSSIKSTIVNDDATLAYRRSINTAYFVVIAEAIGVEYGFSSEQLVDTAKANVQSLSANAEFSEAKRVEVNGIEWLNFTAKVKTMGQHLVYGYLVCTRNGYSYQLISWASGEDQSLAQSDIMNLGKKFKLIENDKVYNSDEFKPIDLFENKELGLLIDLSGEGWTTWPSSALEFPAANFTATKSNEVFVFASALFHVGLNPSYKDLKAGFLAQLLGIDATSGFNSRDKIVTVGSDKILQTTFSSANTLGETNSFIAQIRKYKNFSYIICGYSLQENRLHEVESLLQRVVINPEVEVGSISERLGPEEAFFQSQALNQLAINAYSQNNLVNAKRYLDRALSFDKSDPSIAVNYAAVSIDQGEFQSIIDLYDSEEESFSENVQFLEYYALALFRSNRNEVAEKAFIGIFDSGNMSESGLFSYMELLALQERWADGIPILEDYYELTGSQMSRQWAATFHTELGQFEEALALLNQLKEEKPFDLSIDADIASNYLSSEQYSKTLDYIDSLGDDVDAYPLLYTIKGNALFGLKSYAKAKEAYKTAVGLNPLDDEAQSMLEYATLALGKGDTNVKNTPIAPVELPQGLLDLAAEAEAKKTQGKESEILYTLSAIHYEKGKVHKKTRTTKVLIRDDSGLDSYSTLVFSFDPFYEDIYVNSIIVRDADGKVLSEAVRGDFYILDDSAGEAVSQYRALHVPVSGLAKQCTLEYTITYNATAAVDEFPLETNMFAYVQTSRLCGLAVTGDTGDVVSVASADVVSKADGKAIIWYSENVPGYTIENFQADLETFVPHVILAEKANSWKSEVAQYYAEISDRFAPNAAVTTLAKSLAVNAKSEKEKVAAIYRFIQKEFTYKALAFGPRAQIPNHAEQIASDKYGDCKDLALLANRLLEAVGVRSYLTLVSTSSQIKEEIPSIDQFDHMILYLPDYDGGHFIDCTSKYVSLELSTPLDLDEKQMLVLDWGNPRFISSNKQQASENGIVSDRIVELAGQELKIEESLEFYGATGAYFRSYLTSIQESQHLDAFQSMMSARTSYNLRLEQVELRDLDDTNKPLGIVLRYSIPRAVKRGSGAMTVSSIPSVWEQYYLEVAYVKDRKTPFDIRDPLRFEGTTRLSVPSGYRVVDDPAIDFDESTDFHTLSHERTVDTDLGQVLVHYVVNVRPKKGTATQFASFQNSAQEAVSLITRALEFEFVN